MSWFNYGDQPSRRLRKGVWLRLRNLPKDIRDAARPYMRRIEQLDRVVVQELRSDGRVLLECWSRPFCQSRTRWTVFYLLIQENDDWVCEGDIGRGYVFSKSNPRPKV